MIHTDRPRFAELVAGLCVVFDREPSEPLIEIYWRALADLEMDRLDVACAALIQTSRFFPKPAEIRDAVMGSVQERTDKAWGQVYRALIDTGGIPSNYSAEIKSTIKSLGGEDRMYSMAFKDSDKAERVFKAMYSGMLSRTPQTNNLLTEAEETDADPD